MGDDLQPHPLANLFPMLGDAELRELADDIEANGQQHAITTDQHGRIVDGRNRDAACRLRGITPKVEQRHFASDRDVLRFITSLNVHRRHLTESQRAMIAAQIATMKVGRPADNSANLPNNDSPPVSQSEAATMLNVSTRSVTSAAKVQANGTPELRQAVADGVLPVSAAAAVAGRPADEQRAEVKERKAKGKAPGTNGRAKPAGKKKGETGFAEVIRWAARRKHFTLEEMAEACTYHKESCRRDLNSAIAATGHVVERADQFGEGRYRVRKAVHFVPVDAIPEDASVGLIEILRDLYNDAVQARKFESDFSSSNEWSRTERAQFLNKFISAVRQIIQA